MTSSSGDCDKLTGFVEATFAKPVGQIAAPAFQPEPLKQRSRNEITTTAHGSRRKSSQPTSGNLSSRSAARQTGSVRRTVLAVKGRYTRAAARP